MTTLDQLYAMVRELDPQLELKYNKFYVGLARGGQPHNFVVFRPRRNTLMLTVRLPQSAEMQSRLEESGLELVDFDKREAATVSASARMVCSSEGLAAPTDRRGLPAATRIERRIPHCERVSALQHNADSASPNGICRSHASMRPINQRGRDLNRTGAVLFSTWGPGRSSMAAAGLSPRRISEVINELRSIR